MDDSIAWSGSNRRVVGRGLAAARGLLIGSAVGGAMWLLLLAGALAIRAIL